MSSGARLVAVVAFGLGACVACTVTAFDRACETGAVSPAARALAAGPIITKRIASDQLRAGRSGLAGTLIARAIAQDPMRPDGLALLGIDALAQNRSALAADAFRAAAQLGWREPMTQTYWLNAGLVAGDNTLTAQRLDALLRMRQAGPLIPTAIATLERTADGRRAIAARLANTPPWANDYIGGAISLPDDATITARIATLRFGRQSGMRPDCTRVGQVSRDLATSAMKFDAAADLWFSLCRPAEGMRDRVEEPSFARGDDTDSPFAWTLTQNGDIDQRVERAPQQTSGDALFVQSDSSTADVVAQRLVRLRPGHYTVTWRVLGDHEFTAAPARVTLACTAAPGAQRDAAVTRRGTDGFQTAATVPATDCAVQRLSIAAEPKPLGGAVPFYIADLRVSPVS